LNQVQGTFLLKALSCLGTWREFVVSDMTSSMIENVPQASPSSPDPLAVFAESDPAVLSFASWLAHSFESQGWRQASLSEELSKVQETAAVGATALVELRAAVQKQLESLQRSIGSLQTDLDTTQKELAEVVNETSRNQGWLADQLDHLRADVDVSLERVRAEIVSQFEGGQACQQESFEKALEQLKQSITSQVSDIEERTTSKVVLVQDQVNRCLGPEQPGKEGIRIHDYFLQIDKVMKKQDDQMKELARTQAGLESRCDNEINRLKEVRRELLQSQDLHRKVDALEPRIYGLEESNRTLQSARQHLQLQVNRLAGNASEEALPIMSSSNRPSQTRTRSGRDNFEVQHTPSTQVAPSNHESATGTSPQRQATPLHAPSQSPQQQPLASPLSQMPARTTSTTSAGAPPVVAVAVATTSGNKQVLHPSTPSAGPSPLLAPSPSPPGPSPPPAPTMALSTAPVLPSPPLHGSVTPKATQTMAIVSTASSAAPAQPPVPPGSQTPNAAPAPPPGAAPTPTTATTMTATTTATAAAPVPVPVPTQQAAVATATPTSAHSQWSRPSLRVVQYGRAPPMTNTNQQI